MQNTTIHYNTLQNITTQLVTYTTNCWKYFISLETIEFKLKKKRLFYCLFNCWFKLVSNDCDYSSTK